MRCPTDINAALRWHRDALAGRNPVITTTEPQIGFFMQPLRKGAVPVGARIWIEQPIDDETGELVGDETIHCEIGGEERDPVEAWIWLANYPITEAAYQYLVADAAWARTYAPASPEANPTRRINPIMIPRLF